MDSTPGFGTVLLGRGALTLNLGRFTWLLQIRHDNFMGSDVNELWLVINSSVSGFVTVQSDFIITPGKDYFIAASYDNTVPGAADPAAALSGD